MSRILIDLTDLELWSGNHGGIQRVVYGISKHFFINRDQNGNQIVFMSYSSGEKLFRESSFRPIYERVEELKRSSNSQSLAKEGGLSRKARLRYLLKPYIPERLRKNARAKRVAVKSLNVVLEISKSAKQFKELRLSKPAPNKQTAQAIVFQAEDTVLMLGKPWDNLDIQSTLTQEKNEKGFTLVQVVYDLIISLYPHLHHPSLFTSYTQHMFEVIAASDVLLPISKSTDLDLKKLSEVLNLKMPRTQVIRLGDELISTAVGSEAPDSIIENNFIACVGTVEIRKNHTLLYYTYKLAAERGITLPQLVIVGGQGWLSGDLQYLIQHDPAMKSKIVILNNVSDSGLSWIYEKCLFTIYPSMYEGWGLPVAESLAYGKF